MIGTLEHQTNTYQFTIDRQKGEKKISGIMNMCGERVNNVEKSSTDGKKNKIEEDFPSKRAGYVSVDRISELPDDVLAIILSHLSFKEATQTSVLSTRWRYSWTLFTGTLDFDASDRLKIMNLLHIRSLDIERKRFVNWVNQVLELHQAHSIDGMRICFDVDSKADLDSWISFAVKKRVRLLELNLSRFLYSSQESYNPPLYLLNYLGSSRVTALHLAHVNVSGESLEHILSENPFLESLSVNFSLSLVSLKISGPSLKLKHLKLCCCHELKDLQLSSPNLLSLEYVGPVIPNPFVDVPCLTEVSFRARYCDFIINNLFQFSSLLLQLQKLKLDIYGYHFERFPQNIPELKNLKYLELVVRLARCDHSLLPFTSLLRAAPSLYGFKMKFPVAEASSNEMKVIKEKQPFRCLKSVEIAGFVGGAADMELVLYLLENAVELEKLIIDTGEPLFVETSLESRHRAHEKCEAARQRAAELVARVPPGAELLVL